MSKKLQTPLADATPENLEKAIDKYQRPEVVRMLKAGALFGLDAEKRAEICRRLVGLRSMEIMDFLSRQKEPFTVDMLQLDFDVFQNRDFVRELLTKYSKKFDLSDEKECEAIFAVACTVDNEKTVKQLIHLKKAVAAYPMIGSASMPIFEQITAIPDGLMHDDDRVRLYLQAFLSADWELKLVFLHDAKIDYFLKNTDGKNAADLLEERIRTFKYDNGKKGRLMKLQEEQALKMLRKMESEREQSSDKKKLSLKIKILILCICVAAAAVIGAGIGYYQAHNSASAETTEDVSAEEEAEESTEDETEDTVDETDADEAAEDSETDTEEETDEEKIVSYSTDTSLVVADGDTVNIDYTGYIDDVAFDGGSTDGAGTDLVIGSGSYIDDFEEQLIGANVGDTVTVTVTFPEDYGVDDLNGQEAVFEVTINGIYE
ncbi:MAG: FKBP-type peptidyl-prolyl cis-trans isomerase [Clostridiales bacterium]|nr:FKBP-type peptidyl-prolyl cis-trans isomerase [Clostridiales bacterium]